jgi:hypothetical protein
LVIPKELMTKAGLYTMDLYVKETSQANYNETASYTENKMEVLAGDY